MSTSDGVTFYLYGNTAGESRITGGTLALVGGTNVVLSGSVRSIVVQGPERSNAWAALGVVVSSGSPGPGVLYNDWVAGSSGYWAWISSP